MLRAYLDHKANKLETLLSRASHLKHILHTWERKVKQLHQDRVSTYCYCKQPEFGGMVQCDECMDWFHFSCALLDENFSSLDEWYCKNCKDEDSVRMICVCQGSPDHLRVTMQCKGPCTRTFHPECLGLDWEDMPIATRLTWKCSDC